MHNSIIKNRMFLSLFSNIIAMVISLGVSFILTPFLINNLGKEAYSFFPIANTFINYMNVLSLALNSMAARFITISLASGDYEKSKCYFSTIFYSNFVLCLILLIPMTYILLNLNKLLTIPLNLNNDVKILFILMFLSLIVQLILSVFGVATFAKERMDLYAYQFIGLNILRLSLYIILFKVLPVSISIMGIVSVLLAIYTGVIQFIFSKKLLVGYNIRWEYFRFGYLKELLSSGIWNSLNNLGTVLLQMITIIMANAMISASASGDLAIVQVLPNLMTTIISTVYGVLLPRIANVYAKNNTVETVKTVQMSQRILGVISTIPVIIIILFSKHFFALWVPNENAYFLHKLSIIVILPLLIHSSMWTVYGLNVMNNKVKWPAIVFIFFGLMNVLISYYVIKKTNLGLIGITSVSTILNIIYYMCFLPYYTAENIGVNRCTFYYHILKTIVFSLLVCCATYKFISNLIITSWFKLFIYVLIFYLLFEILYVLLFLNKDEKDIIANYIKNS